MMIMNRWQTEEGEFVLLDISTSDRCRIGTKSFADGVLLLQLAPSNAVACALNDRLQRQQVDVEAWLKSKGGAQ